MRNKILNRFTSKYKHNLKTDCWEWLAGKHVDGYGTFWVNRKNSLAHRVSYELFVGSIPPSLSVLHTCDNPSCVNPKHLFVGTQDDNMKDMIQKNRKKVINGSNLPQSKLTIQQVLEIRKKEKFQYEYAKDFGVCQATVREAQVGLTWKHVKPATPVLEGRAGQ